MELQICTSPACVWARLDSFFPAAVQSHAGKEPSRRAQASFEREISRTRLVERPRGIALNGIARLANDDISRTRSIYRSWRIAPIGIPHPGNSEKSAYCSWGTGAHRPSLLVIAHEYCLKQGSNYLE